MAPGTISKFGVSRPHVRTWNVSVANVLYWRKLTCFWYCWVFSAPRTVVPPPMVVRRPGNCSPFSPPHYAPAPCIHILQSFVNIAPLPKAFSWTFIATVVLWHVIRRGSDIVTEQERSLSISMSPRLSHAIRKDKPLHTAAFQARWY